MRSATATRGQAHGGRGPAAAGARRPRARALLVLAFAALGAGLLFFLTPPETFADRPAESDTGQQKCAGAGAFGGWIRGCWGEGGVSIEGQLVVGQPGRQEPGAPGSQQSGGPGSQRPPCPSPEERPTPANYWLFNLCFGTNYRYSPSTGMIINCDTIDPDTHGFLGGHPYLAQAIIEACFPESRPPTPPGGGPPTGPSGRPGEECIRQAQEARPFPRPQIDVNPRLGLTGLKSYFWLTNYEDDMRISASLPLSCQVEGEWRAISGRVDARVVRYLWDFGDGWGMDTTTPGAPWPRWLSEVHHTYERSSLQQPDQKYLVRVWAFWHGTLTVQAERQVCYTDQNGNWRCTTERRTFGPYDLGEIYIVGRMRYPVQQAQSVIQAPDQGQ